VKVHSHLLSQSSLSPFKIENTTQWRNYLIKEKGVTEKVPSFGMAALPPPTIDVLKECLDEMTFAFLFRPPQV
jgi:hypothetical protein